MNSLQLNTNYNKECIVEYLDSLNNNQEFMDAVNNIRPGKFDRDSNSPSYNYRLVYAKYLREFSYNQIALNIIFSDQELKEKFFRTFGYKGDVEFTIYPNCWLRDLPLLDIGKKVYLGDGILLGTNQVTPDQKNLIVDRIKIGDNTLFSQQCMVGYGSTIGRDCIVGIRSQVGFKTEVGNNVILESNVGVEHGVKIGNNVHIGANSGIGSFTIIEEGVVLPKFSNIPAYSLVTKEGVFSRRKTNVVEVDFTEKALKKVG